jgi:hypothetical protein
MLRRSAGDTDVETGVGEMSSWKYFIEPLQRGKVRCGSDHLKHTPMNDGFSVEYNGAGSRTQGNAVTATQQVAKVWADQNAGGATTVSII